MAKREKAFFRKRVRGGKGCFGKADFCKTDFSKGGGRHGPQRQVQAEALKQVTEKKTLVSVFGSRLTWQEQSETSSAARRSLN